MINKWQFYTTISIIVFVLASTVKKTDLLFIEGLHHSSNDTLLYQATPISEFTKKHIQIPFTGKSFAGFKQLMAHKESQSNYKSINSLGYMGKYQFGKSTLSTIGIRDSIAFMNSPVLQEKAFMALLSYNKHLLKNEIKKYEGQYIRGVLVTESGILAAAHLGGAGSVKSFLKTGGRTIKTDAYGTSILTYMKRFEGYDTSVVIIEKKVKISLK